jgi:hypothetical protein
MTRRAFLLPLVLCWMVAMLAPSVPTRAGGVTWLIDLTPLFILFAAIRLEAGWLVLFLLLGSLGEDFLIPDRIGTGPILWAMVAFLIRSQRPWIRSESWFTLMIMCFGASFLYAVGDRALYLMTNDLWSWSYLLGLKLVVLALVNAVLVVPFTWVMDYLCGITQAREKGADFSSSYALH